MMTISTLVDGVEKEFNELYRCALEIQSKCHCVKVILVYFGKYSPEREESERESFSLHFHSALSSEIKPPRHILQTLIHMLYPRQNTHEFNFDKASTLSSSGSQVDGEKNFMK